MTAARPGETGERLTESGLPIKITVICTLSRVGDVCSVTK